MELEKPNTPAWGLLEEKQILLLYAYSRPCNQTQANKLITKRTEIVLNEGRQLLPWTERFRKFGLIERVNHDTHSSQGKIHQTTEKGLEAIKEWHRIKAEQFGSFNLI